MSVKIDGHLVSDLQIEMVHLPSGVSLQTDPPLDNGGQGLSFSPTDLLAAAYGSCMMTVMALRAKKDGLSLNGMRLELRKIMSDPQDPPRRVRLLEVDLHLPIEDSVLKESYLDTARHCPVAKSLSSTIEVCIRLI